MGKTGGIARSPAAYGAGAGRGMLLQEILCTGEEGSLSQCSASTAAGAACAGAGAGPEWGVGVDCIDPGECTSARRHDGMLLLLLLLLLGMQITQRAPAASMPCPSSTQVD